jgi:phosphomannomutase
VALDCCNGAGVGISLRLLRSLGCSVEPIHCTPDGLFPHTPEPNFDNLQDLCRFTREREADVGFATDPDADRIAVVSEGGDFLGEELSLALSAQYVLRKRNVKNGTIVINMSTSRVTVKKSFRLFPSNSNRSKNQMVRHGRTLLIHYH